MPSDKDYMREYMRRRYNERRALAIQWLGGKCIKCGSEDDLEIDHINPSTKAFSIDQLRSQSVITFWTEIAKCQLLCKRHHAKKHTCTEHGSATMYRNHGCRCASCKRAHAAKVAAFRALKKSLIPA